MERRLKLTAAIIVWLLKFWFFTIFWTFFLGPIEYYCLGIPFEWVCFIRSIAIITNFWWKWAVYDRPIWRQEEDECPAFTSEWWADKRREIAQMVTMKFLVNVSNFLFLLLMTTAYETDYQLSFGGFIKKVSIIIGMAIILAVPYGMIERKLFPKKKVFSHAHEAEEEQPKEEKVLEPVS